MQVNGNEWQLIANIVNAGEWQWMSTDCNEQISAINIKCEQMASENATNKTRMATNCNE